MARRRQEEPAPPSRPVPAKDWSSPAGRLRWLLETRFRGNATAFAEMIGFSHTIIGKVARGQSPGRRLLEAVARNLPVSPTWLLTGGGQPFLVAPDVGGGRPGLPVSQVVLPGPPLEHQDLLTGDWVDATPVPLGPSQYWLELVQSQPILRDKTRGFRVGDRILMETDRTRFPRKATLYDHLCVVRLADRMPSPVLAAVNYHLSGEEPEENIEADPFDSEPDPSQLVREEVYVHLPNGEVRHEQRRLRSARFWNQERLVPMDSSEPDLPSIQYHDIVAVWLQLIRRWRAND
jgi:hypothetical protein